MKGVFNITTVVCILACIGTGAARKCLNCAGVAHPYLCKHVTTCYDDEICGMQTQTSLEEARLYTLGCFKKTTCKAAAILHGESSPAFHSCLSCCDDYDLCNIRGCNSTGFPVNRGPVCYSCQASQQGSDCPTIEHCEEHEVCYTEATLEFLTKTLYVSGCRSKHNCAGNSIDPLTSFIGKRSAGTNDKAFDAPNIINKRSLSVCTDCCEADLCNRQCKQADACHDDPYCATLQPLVGLSNLCSNQELAVKFCKRTCNLCKSAKSCGDLRVDCVHINQTVDVCSTRMKAYEHGCLGHCGYCSTPPSTTPAARVITTAPSTRSLTTTTLPTTAPTTRPTTATTTTPTTTSTTTTPTTTSTTTTPTTTSTTTTPTTTSTTTTPTTTSTTTTPTTTSTTTTPTTTSTTTTPTTTSTTTTTPSTTTATTTPLPTTTPPPPTPTDTTTAAFTFPLHPVFVPKTSAPSPTASVVPASRTYTNGSRVRRGIDWKGGNEDGHGPGTIVDTSIPGLVSVIWDNGNTSTYNMGKDGQYELDVIATSTKSPVVTPLPVNTVSKATHTMNTSNGTSATPFYSSTIQLGSNTTASTGLTSQVNTQSSVAQNSTPLPTNLTNPTTKNFSATSSNNNVRSSAISNAATSAHTSTSSTASLSTTALTSVVYSSIYPASTPTTTSVLTPVVMTTIPISKANTTTDMSTAPMTMSTITITPNCIQRPPNVTHGFPTVVNRAYIIYKCYKAYRFPSSTQTQTRRVNCDSSSQTWETPLPTCVAKAHCVDSTDCLNQGTCDVTSQTCMCAPGFFNTNCDTTLHIGDLVTRGPNWRWGSQDGNGTGTVVPSSSQRKGWVRVRWNNGGNENSYRFGVDGNYDVLPYNSPYIVPNLQSPSTQTPTQTALPTYGPALFDKMCVGCRVVRGLDWKWGDQDSNGAGTVVSKDSTGGWVKVQWDNGKNNTYRMGSENAFDLMLAP